MHLAIPSSIQHHGVIGSIVYVCLLPFRLEEHVISRQMPDVLRRIACLLRLLIRRHCRSCLLIPRGVLQLLLLLLLL